MTDTSGPRPFRCPVCDGRGQVPRGFYNASVVEYAGSTSGFLSYGQECCRTCHMTGIVWSAVGMVSPVLRPNVPDDENHCEDA